MRQGEKRRTSGHRRGLALWPTFVPRKKPREPCKKRTTGGHGEDIGFWGCFLVVLLVPQRFVAQARMLSRLHADRLRGHAVELRFSRLPAGAFPLGVQLFSRLSPFDCAWWCHVFTLQGCDLDISRRTTRDNRRTRRGQQEDKMHTRRRTRRGQQADKKRTQEDNVRTLRSPARPERLWPAFSFPKREPQQ